MAMGTILSGGFIREMSKPFVGVVDGDLPDDLNAGDNFIGGVPLVVDGCSFSDDQLECFVDKHPLNLLAQLYAPVYPSDDEEKVRILYIMGCNSDHFKRTAKCYSFTKTFRAQEPEAAEEVVEQPAAPAATSMADMASMLAGMSITPAAPPQPTPAPAVDTKADPVGDLLASGQPMDARRGDHPGQLLYIKPQPEMREDSALPALQKKETGKVAVEDEEEDVDNDDEGKSKGKGKGKGKKAKGTAGAAIPQAELDRLLPADDRFMAWSLRFQSLGAGVVLRYCRGGEPFIPESITPPTLPPCPRCGGKQVWEAQLISTALHHLGSEDRTHGEGAMDWFAVLLGGCEAACGEGLQEETVHVIAASEV